MCSSLSHQILHFISRVPENRFRGETCLILFRLIPDVHIDMMLLISRQISYSELPCFHRWHTFSYCLYFIHFNLIIIWMSCFILLNWKNIFNLALLTFISTKDSMFIRYTSTIQNCVYVNHLVLCMETCHFHMTTHLVDLLGS